MVLLPVLGLLAGAGIAVALLLALSSHTGPGSPAVAAETHGNGSLVLDAQDYVGRPVDDVASRLTGLGLQVQLKSVVRSDVVPEQVTGIDPAGKPLKAGDVVVVTYAVANAEDGAQRQRAAVTGSAVGVATSSAAAGQTAADAVAADPTAGGDSGGGTSAVTTPLPASPAASDPSASGSPDRSTSASAPTTTASASPTSSSPSAAG
jgi:serine/threonine-protein kinase